MTVEEGAESLSGLLGYSVIELQKNYQNRLIDLILPEDQEMVYSSLRKRRYIKHLRIQSIVCGTKTVL